MAWTFYTANGEAKTLRQFEQSTLPMEPWHTIGTAPEPLFENSWVGWGVPTAFRDPQYRKDPFGRVHLRGVMKNGTIAAVAFTLPPGYRPPGPAAVLFDTVGGVNQQSRIDINANGQVTPTMGANGFYSLDGLYFDTDTSTYTSGSTTVTGAPTVYNLPTTGLIDNQDVNLLVDTAGTYGGPYIWPVRYNLASASWIALGGEPLEVRPDWGTDRTFTGTISTFGALSAIPETQILAPYNGLYRVEFGAGIFNDNNAYATNMGISVFNAGGTETSAATQADSIESYENAGAGVVKSQMAVVKRTLVINGGVRLRFGIFTGTAAGGRVRRRWLRISPIRLTG